MIPHLDAEAVAMAGTKRRDPVRELDAAECTGVEKHEDTGLAEAGATPAGTKRRGHGKPTSLTSALKMPVRGV